MTSTAMTPETARFSASPARPPASAPASRATIPPTSRSPRTARASTSRPIGACSQVPHPTASALSTGSSVASGDLAYVAPIFGGAIGTALSSVALSADGATLVFTSDEASLNPLGGVSDNDGGAQYYRYRDTDRSLICVSCPADGSPPLDEVDAHLHEIIDGGLHNNRALSADGSTLAFATVTPLVGADQNTPGPAPTRCRAPTSMSGATDASSSSPTASRIGRFPARRRGRRAFGLRHLLLRHRRLHSRRARRSAPPLHRPHRRWHRVPAPRAATLRPQLRRLRGAAEQHPRSARRRRRCLRRAGRPPRPLPA